MGRSTSIILRSIARVAGVAEHARLVERIGDAADGHVAAAEPFGRLADRQRPVAVAQHHEQRQRARGDANVVRAIDLVDAGVEHLAQPPQPRAQQQAAVGM